MEELRKFFIELGYKEEEYEIIVNTYSLSNLKVETLLNKVKENYNFLIELGYSREDVIKMTKISPAIYSLSIETIKQKIEDLKKLGYSREDVIKITKTLPAIYGYSIKNIKQKIEDLKELGYSREDVIKMTKTLPTLYNLSIENIKQKIEFYDSINLHSLAVEDTKRLMQSTALSYARYMFYKEKGITIDKSNYKKLFIGQKQFERQYGINNKDLIARYDYKKVLEDKEKRHQGLKSTQELGIETVEEQKNPTLLDKIEESQNSQLIALKTRKHERNIE